MANVAQHPVELNWWRPDSRRDVNGAPLTPGVNVDPIDVAAGCEMASRLGYNDGKSQMVVEYALMRRRHGEEGGAQRTALGHGIDLTSWYAIVAVAVTHAKV